MDLRLNIFLPYWKHTDAKIQKCSEWSVKILFFSRSLPGTEAAREVQIIFKTISSEFFSQTVLDHETWVMNLKEANLYGYPIWYKLYSARDAYQLPSLMPQDWNNLITKFAENDESFDTYYKYEFVFCKQWSSGSNFLFIRYCSHFPDTIGKIHRLDRLVI